MFVLFVVTLAAGFSAAWAADGTSEPIAGIGPTGPVTKLHGDFMFTEGPAGDRMGNVFFSDVRGNKTYKIDSKGKLSVFREPSNNSNGLMVNAGGELVACEMQGRVVAISADGKTVRPLAEKYEGKRFNAPNDLVIDRQGGVYFTDPHFMAPQPLPQVVSRVYYINAPSWEVTRLIDPTCRRFNGVILSPDEKTLYVIPSMQAEMMAYPVEAPGKLGAGRVFCTLEQAAGKTNAGGDGFGRRYRRQRLVHHQRGSGAASVRSAGQAAGHHQRAGTASQREVRRPREPHAVRHRPHVGLHHSDASHGARLCNRRSNRRSAKQRKCGFHFP